MYNNNNDNGRVGTGIYTNDKVKDKISPPTLMHLGRKQQVYSNNNNNISSTCVQFTTITNYKKIFLLI